MDNALQTELLNWLNSKERDEMLTADKYYSGKHDILTRQRTALGPGGQLVPIENLPNHRIVDNQYRLLVDKKANYALGKPFTVSTENEAYSKELLKIFSKRFYKKFRSLGINAINQSKCWLHPYYNSSGELKFKVFKASEVFPIWEDSDHETLLGAIRIYPVKVYENGQVKIVTMAEEYTPEGVQRYKYNGRYFCEDGLRQAYLSVDEVPYNWGKTPLIEFRYTEDDAPLIRFTKELQDAINLITSNFVNNMDEDPRTTILILKNYDGENLGEFRRNLATYGVVKVRSMEGMQGGVESLRIEVNASNYQAVLMQLKRALVENGRGFDAKEERMDGDPNQMNIMSMYTDIDIDTNALEAEFQQGFEDLLWFINQHLMRIGKGDFSEDKVEIVFNRDIFVNESELIKNCMNSVGIISNETIVANHPWTVDLQRELKLLKQQENEEMEMFSYDKSGGTGGGEPSTSGAINSAPNEEISEEQE